MNIKTKRICTAFTAAVMTAALAVGTGLIINNNKTVLAEDAQEGATYYYEKLGSNEQAKKFYNAFQTLDKSGAFKKGKIEYDLVANGVVTGGDVSRYVNNGDKTLPYALGGGRDSYLLDNPDLFYIDIYGTSISAGSMGSEYVAYLDSSRTDTLYLGELDTEAKINSAISAYDSVVNKIAADARAQGGAKEQIEYVNEYIATHTEYSFGTVLQNDRNVDTPATAYISTSYGALVNGKAICGGFSKAFKAVMDRLEIPCVCVQGYGLSEGKDDFEAHMWNYVKLEGIWYAVDVTWNSSASDVNEWLLLGSDHFMGTHQADNIVSTSNFELDYPAINPYDYGNNKDANGMEITGEYYENDGYGKSLEMTVKFNSENKNAEQLEAEGKYLAYRYGAFEDGELIWTPWYNVIGYIKFQDGTVENGKGEANGAKISGDTLNFLVFPQMAYCQVALINRAPDDNFGANSDIMYYYNTENFNEEEDYAVAPCSAYENEGYHSYVPAPFGYGTPSDSGTLKVTEVYDISITYTESLKLKDPDNPVVELEVTSARGNDTIKESCKVENFQWDGDKTISFTFTPSRMFIHNAVGIHFTPTNLVGVDSGKVPTDVIYYFEGKTVVCSRVFNDGRQYMLVYGQPEILADTDLSEIGFQDENGHYYAESQRSQLILVASKPDEDRQAELDETLYSDETKLKETDVVASTSYEIDLTLCGCVTTVPNGSFMQVSLGFPEGYSPNDAGTTFKIYHYKHDNAGNITGIEEIPVIVTEYGLIARVTSFSPFTIVQVKNTSAAVTESTSKNIYASVNGKGGSIKTESGESGITQVTGNSIKYIITKESGYAIASVYLNGTLLDAAKYADGTLTLSAEELSSDNLLEVTFVNAEIAQSYAAKSIAVYTPSGYEPADIAETPDDGDSTVTPAPTPGEGTVTPEPTPGEGTDTPDTTPGDDESSVTPAPTPDGGEKAPGNSTTLIVILCVLIVIAVAAGVALVFVLKKKKSE